MEVDKFLDAVNKIEDNTKLLSVIHVDDVKHNVKLVKDRLNKLKIDQLKVLDLLEKTGKLNPNKIEEVKKQIISKYFGNSIADKVSSLKYDPILNSPNLIKKESIVSVRRDHFIDQDFSARFLIDPIVSPVDSRRRNRNFEDYTV